MDMNTLVVSLRTGLEENVELAAWCQTQYGRAHTVHVGYDGRNPPGEGACPAVLLYPTGHAAGRGSPEKRYALDVVGLLYDEDVLSGWTEKTTEYDGVRQLEAFRAKIVTALLTADTGAATLEAVEVDYEVVELFPFFAAGMACEWKEPVTIGSDPLSE